MLGTTPRNSKASVSNLVFTHLKDDIVHTKGKIKLAIQRRSMYKVDNFLVTSSFS
jgi:hypothetical protein